MYIYICIYICMYTHGNIDMIAPARSWCEPPLPSVASVVALHPMRQGRSRAATAAISGPRDLKVHFKIF